MSHIFCLVPEGKPIRGQWVLSLEYSLFYFGMPLRNANFYLACHKNKTAFARRAQRKDSFERPGNFCSVCLPGTVKKQRTDRGVVKTTYPAITPHDHRGVSALSFRDGAIHLGTPTFKLACLNNKTEFARRAQRTQRKDSCERPGNAEL